MNSRARAVGLVAGLVLTAMSVTTGTSSATGNDQVLTVYPGQLPPDAFPYNYGYSPFSDWKVGDCHLLVGSYVVVDGNRVLLHGVTGTDFTSGADVWHSDFEFDDADGNFLYRTGGRAFDSPDMVPLAGRGHSGPSGVYNWDRQVTLDIPPTLHLFVRSVKWRSRC